MSGSKETPAGQDIGRRLRELAERAERTCTYTYTDFLNMQELSVYKNMQRELDFVPGRVFGGTDHSERCMVRFGDGKLCGYEEEFPISVLKIEPVLDKFADDLSHRDFLGAILGLGLEREKTGDIVVRNNRAYAFVRQEIAEYIVDNLEYVKHTHVRVSVLTEMPEDLAPRFERNRIIVSSNRTDAVIAKLFKLSREAAANLVTERKVFINGAESISSSKSLNPGDIVSVRGSGKFVFRGEAGRSKKDRLYLDIDVYA